jgi:hypothetical protein
MFPASAADSRPAAATPTPVPAIPPPGRQAKARPPARINARRVDQIEARAVEWLWRVVLPLGKVCILDGDPGLGKSTVLLDLAARVTMAGVMPDDTQGLTGTAVIAALAVHTALFRVPALTLILSPSQRQSGETFRKIKDAYNASAGPRAPSSRTSSPSNWPTAPASSDDASDVRPVLGPRH